MMKNEFEKLIENTMEYICDNLCKYPVEFSGLDDLEYICAACKMKCFVDGFKDSYDVMNGLLKKLGDYTKLPDQTYRGQPIYIRESERKENA